MHLCWQHGLKVPSSSPSHSQAQDKKWCCWPSQLSACIRTYSSQAPPKSSPSHFLFLGLGSNLTTIKCPVSQNSCTGNFVSQSESSWQETTRDWELGLPWKVGNNTWWTGLPKMKLVTLMIFWCNFWFDLL
jgi:hypothetical protein